MKKSPIVPSLRFPEFENEWIKYKLGDLMTIKSASRVHKNEWKESGVPFFRSSDVVSDYKGIDNNKAFISNELFRELTAKSGKVKKHDLLVTGGGSIGIPYLVPNDDPLYFKDADLLWFKNSKHIHSYFLYTFLLTTIFRKYLNSVTHIGTIAHYTIEQAKSTPITLPSISEQEKIAEFFAAVDKKIEQLTRMKELLENYKKGVMQKLFSQEIRFKDENGEDFPNWKEYNVDKFLKLFVTNSFSRNDLTYESGKVKNIHYGDIHSKFKMGFKVNEETVPYIVEEKKLSKYDEDQYVKPGDLILADASEDYVDIGKAIEVLETGDEKILAGLHTIHARDKKPLTAVGFKGYLFRSEAVRKQLKKVSQGASVLGISKSNFKEINVKLPCMAEQQKIVAFLQNIDKNITLVESKIEKFQTFKKGLLQQMFV